MRLDGEFDTNDTVVHLMMDCTVWRYTYNDMRYTFNDTT